MSVRQVLGARISSARRALNITQSDLAKAVGVGANQVSRWERGDAMPGPRYLGPLADALHMDREELFVLAIEAGAEDATALRKENDRIIEVVKELIPQLRELLQRDRERDQVKNNG